VKASKVKGNDVYSTIDVVLQGVVYVIRDVVRIALLLLATISFELRRMTDPDGPYGLMKEGSLNVLPRTAIVLHLEQRRVLFCCPSNALFLRLQ
jgi:hypothetical protein